MVELLPTIHSVIRQINGAAKDDLRNLGMLSYLKLTFSSEANLASFLDTVHVQHRANIEEDIRAAFSAASDKLFAMAQSGALDPVAFGTDLRAKLMEEFPWLSEAALAGLIRYCEWMGWHEGFWQSSKTAE